MSRQVGSILAKSARIQLKIDQEQGRQAPNWITLLRLKVLRLRLKDRLRDLAPPPPRQLRPATAAACSGA